MRLWTLHPMYLDARGLVAVWREGLLAQSVLRGHTRGYTKHPQLARFRKAARPLACIAAYLAAVHDEASDRGYSFDRRKIGRARGRAKLPATVGQVEYEWRHLKRKLTSRDRLWLARLKGVGRPRLHPLFRTVPGDVEDWEVTRPRHRRTGG